MTIYNVSEPIVRQYVLLVESGKRTIDSIPDKFKEEVANILNISLENHQELTDRVAVIEATVAELLSKNA